MKAARRSCGAVIALTLALGATAVAAQATAGPAPRADGSKESRAPAPAGARTGSDASVKQASERMHRASRIIGMDVVNRQGEKVGDIEDIVLDRNGYVAYAVVATGGFLGVGDKLHAVPWRSLQPGAGTDQFTLDVDKERLSKAPGFDSNSFPDLGDPRWSAENRRHFPLASSAASRSSTMGSESNPPKKKEPRERDDTRSSSGRSPTGSDVGTTTSTAKRSGPAAGSGSAAAAPDAGSTAGTAAGVTAAPDNERRPPGGTGGSSTGAVTTDPSAIPVNPSAPGAPAPGTGATTGTTK